MYELHRDVLSVCGERSATESQQAASALEALRHLLASHRQPAGFLLEEVLTDPVALEESLLHPPGELLVLHHRQITTLHQQIRGSGSPTSMSTTRLSPYSAATSTVPRGCSRTSPTIRASCPPGARLKASSPASACSGAITARNWPSFAMWSGSRPSSSQAPRTVSRTGMLSSER